MTALLITPTPTHPANAGNRARVMALAEVICDMGVDLHIAYVRREQGGDETAMMNHWGETRCHFMDSKERARSKTLVRRSINKICRTLRIEKPDEPYGIDDWCGDEMLEDFNRLTRSIRPDIVWVEYVFLSRLFEAVPPGVLKVLDTHDVFASRHKMMRLQGKQPEWFFTTSRQERIGCRRADVVVAIQDREREYFSRAYGVSSCTIGHFVDIRPTASPSAKQPLIVFVGSDNAANLDALEWFVFEIWPTILTSLPDARFEIYGDSGKVLQGRLIPGVQVQGRVACLDTAYERAWVIIAPLRMGTGLKIKSIEALGRGKALVASPCGAEGMEDGADEAFLMARSAEGFTKACVAALTSDETRARLEAAAIDYAQAWNARNRIGLGTVFSRSAW